MFRKTNLLASLILMVNSTMSCASELVEVSIKDFKYLPAKVTVKIGTTVRWINNEKRQYHNVWFEKSGDLEPDYIFPEEFYEKTFNKAGTFPYHCGPHPEMLGEVIVTE